MLQDNSKRILVVDDDSFIVSLTVSALQKLGYSTIDTAGDGVDALKKLDNAAATYDIIICDLNMPEMDGIEFMKCANQRCFQGGLILLSGEDKRILQLALEMAECQKLNILGYLTKPINASILSDILSEHSNLTSEETQSENQQAISEAELLLGLRNGSESLVLYFEPIAHIRSGEIIGVETIAKWKHSTRGILEPEAFVPVAQEYGHMNELAINIYNKAVKQTAAWLSDGIFLQNHIEISLDALTTNSSVDLLLNKPTELGIAQKHINLEITDSEIDNEDTELTELLMRFHFKKIGIVIDNFDLGAPDMSRVSNFPFSQIKSHRDLLHSTNSDPQLGSTVKKNNSLAKKLNLEVAVKGIYDREDWNQAESLGFDCVQGEFCSAALSNDNLLEFLDNWNPPPRRC